MRYKNDFRKHFRIFLCLFTLVLLCMAGSMTASAKISTDHIETVNDGEFVRKGSKWMYRLPDGTFARKCLLEIDGRTYCFSAKGYRQSGWKKIGQDFYYFGTSSEGFMYKLKWLKTSGGDYYFLKSSGKRAVGWMTYQGKTHYFDEDGKRLSGWQIIDKKKYYLGTQEEGYKYKDGWLVYKGRIFYLKKNGTPKTGWKTVDGKRYYFSKEGRAYKGRKKIGSTWYTFGQDGVLQYGGANLSIASECAILINADTGAVLYEKNADGYHANASTTKIMTCILALENCSLDEIVTVSENAAQQEPTKLYMKAGDSFVLEDLLYSLMLPSHNDTAVAIAEHISGSVSGFAKLMNQKAKSLGCKGTNFVTPNGLDKTLYGNSLNHYSTARDIARIAQYAMKNETFRKIVKTASYSFSSRKGSTYQVSSTNALFGKISGISGIKTGYTSKAGHCFVGSVTAKNGHTYISVVLGGPTSTQRWTDSQKLLQFARNRT